LSKAAKKSWKTKEFFIFFFEERGRNRKALDRNIYLNNGTRGIIKQFYFCGIDTKH